MKKLYITAVTILVAGLMLHGNALAQQTPASTPSPAAKASPSPAAKAPTAKTGQPSAAKSKSDVTLDTDKDKLSYAIGVNVGRSLQKDSVEVDPSIVVRGLKDALAGGKTLMTDDEAKAVIVALQTDLHKKQEAAMQAAGEVNKKQGDVFLAANKMKEGVVTLPSGLQYKILTAGTGAKPSATRSEE